MPGGRTAYVTLPADPIHIPGFEGPLEALLHLLDAGELEITAVSLVAVTDQFLALLSLLPRDTAKLDFLAEFLVVAAQLLLLKSRALLPREAERTDKADELDEETLARRLLEYRQFREAAAKLRERHERGERAFARQAPAPLPPTGPAPRLESASPALLARALQRLLASRAPASEQPEVPRVTLAQRLGRVRAAVRAHCRVSFTWLAEDCPTRTDLIITFLAVLELFRAHEVVLEQEELFGEIWVAALGEA
ncbi:MAG: segregation/condensation protein A [Chloroflexi bacterium]|nr:segregation/condensation protein A [Chloroflexota bacterium]